MFEKMFLIAILAVLAIFIVGKTYGWTKILQNFLPFIIVDAQTAVVLDNRMGKDRVIFEGIRFYIPGIEVPVKTISLKEQQIDPPAHEIITKDNIKLQIDMIGFYKIKNPMKAVFEVEDYEKSLKSLIMSETLRRLGLMNFSDIQVKQKELAKDIHIALKDDATRWGLEVVKIDFEEIAPPQSIKDAMEKEVTAEKEKKAAILKAEGEHKVHELHADSEKILIEKKAEAIHGAIKQFKELMPNIADETIMNFLTSNAHIDSIKNISNSSGTKFVLYPTDAGQPLNKLMTTEYLSKATDEPKNLDDDSSADKIVASEAMSQNS